MNKLLIVSLAVVIALAAAFGGGNGTPQEPVIVTPGGDGPVDNGGDEPIAPGGSYDYSDPNAPKTIESTELTSFECEISLLSIVLPENGVLTNQHYAFTARLEGGEVACIRYTDWRGKESFTMTPAFMGELQKLIVQHKIAGLNGIDTVTYGLPDEFGARISAAYASGESIYAYATNDMFLPLAFVEDLGRLFYGEGFGRQYLQITMDEAQRLIEEGFGGAILDVRRPDEYAEGHIPGAINVPNEDIQAGLEEIEYFRNIPLLIYCRSGNRSKQAAQKLVDDGCAYVAEFGGIIDWPGEIVKD